MPPCNCKGDTLELEGFFKFKFVGKPSGTLMKGAPKGYNQGDVVELSYRYNNYPWWELLDPPPVLNIPPAKVEDSVFEGNVFVPPSLEEADIPSGLPTSEPSVNPTALPVESAIESGVKEAVEEPFKEEEVSPEDEMPEDLKYELTTMGDGVIGEFGVEKIERRKKNKKRY